MPESEPYTPPTSDASERPQRSLRPWFIGGFALAFGALLFSRELFYTGTALVECKLWLYYLLKIKRSVTSSKFVGPTSGSGTQAFILFVGHLILSAIAGFLATGLRAFVRRFHP